MINNKVASDMADTTAKKYGPAKETYLEQTTEDLSLEEKTALNFLALA
jgi:hypothetical protein